MGSQKDSTHKLLQVFSLPIILLLLSAGFAFPIGNTLASPGNAKPASYLSRISPPATGNFHRYREQSLSAGKFLVASEKIRDPRFAKTIILLVDYNSRGAVGLIINRPTATGLPHVLPNVKGIHKTSDKVYFGGPVALNKITMIIRSSGKPAESLKIFNDIYISNSLALLEQIIGTRGSDRNLRIYSGYAGWIPGQLEMEIARGDWSILKAAPDILFEKEPEKLWQRLVPRGIGGLEI